MGEANSIMNEVDFNTVENIRSFVPDYDKVADSLLLQPHEPDPAVSVDWNGEMWLRINPENGEIIGVEIEDYKKFFARKYRKYIRGIRVTDPSIKKFVIFLLRGGMRATPFTKKDFIKALERVSSRVA